MVNYKGRYFITYQSILSTRENKHVSSWNGHIISPALPAIQTQKREGKKRERKKTKSVQAFS